MSIQNLSYELHQAIKSKGFDVKRSHVYELIAAAFGFNTYNQLHLNAIPLYADSSAEIYDLTIVIGRCQTLKISLDVIKILENQLSNHFFIYKTKDDLSSLIRNVLNQEEYPEHSNLLKQLEKTTEIFSQQSIYPYLIAQFYCDCENNFSVSTSMQYLYDRYLQGKEISPTWKPNLEHFIARKNRNERFKENYVFYLTRASELGSFPAQLQLSQFESDGDFEGEEVFDEDEYSQYSTYVPHIELELAKRGNERVLREIFDKVTLDNYGDLKKLTDDELIQAWKWQKFALFLGFDLAKGNYQARAIHENGNYYDDDVGGPIFVAESGREDIHLPKLSLEQEVLVAKEVKRLIEFYQNLDEFYFNRYSNDSSDLAWDDEYEDDFDWNEDY